MIAIQQQYLIAIHIASIGTFVSSIVIMVIALLALFHFIFIRSYRLMIPLFLFQITMFVFLFGFTIYASSTSVRAVDLWTRISYTGVSIVPFAFYLFIETVIEKRYRAWKYFLALASVLLTAAVWIDRTYIITGSFDPNFIHPSMLKGKLFIVYYLVIVALIIANHAILALQFLRDRTFRENSWPLLIGLIVWTLNCFFDGLFAEILKVTRSQLWIGPVVMSLMVVIYFAMNSERLQRTIWRIMEEKEVIYQQMIRDPLTGTFTRTYLEKVLKTRNETFNASKDFLSLLFIDLDNFKWINDTQSHGIGDMMLQLMGDILHECCRRSDVPARYGGDEFVLLLFNCTEEAAVKIARGIRTRYNDACSKIIRKDTIRHLGLSVGIATSESCKGKLEQMVDHSDLAMYYAKKKGMNNIALYRFESKKKQYYIELVK